MHVKPPLSSTSKLVLRASRELSDNLDPFFGAGQWSGYCYRQRRNSLYIPTWLTDSLRPAFRWGSGFETMQIFQYSLPSTFTLFFHNRVNAPLTNSQIIWTPWPKYCYLKHAIIYQLWFPIFKQHQGQGFLKWVPPSWSIR